MGPTSVLRYLGVLALCASMLLLAGTAQSDLDQTYYDYIEDHPSDVETYFSVEVQGLAHYDRFWYITDHWQLWRVPLGLDLAILHPGDRVQRLRISDVQPLWARATAPEGVSWEPKFNDLDCHGSGGRGYVLIPVEYQTGDDPRMPKELPRPEFCPRIAVFSADSSLKFIDSSPLAWRRADGTYYFDGAPWCAVRPSDRALYLSNNGRVSSVWRLRVDWSLLQEQSGSTPRLRLDPEEEIRLLDSLGNPVWIKTVQGGAFSEDGRYLYLAASDEGTPYGLLAFDMNTYKDGAIRLVMESEPVYQSYAAPHSPLFRYSLDLFFWGEAEGLDVWDLDDGTSPDCGAWSGYSCDDPVYRRCSGQLHAIVLDNNWPENDQVLIKHYTNAITVDGACTGSEEEGTVYHPFATIERAISFYESTDAAGWDGAKIRIRAGSYHEAPLLFGTHASAGMHKRMQLTSYAGTAVLGSQGRIALHPSGKVNVNEGGGLTVH